MKISQITSNFELVQEIGKTVLKVLESNLHYQKKASEFQSLITSGEKARFTQRIKLSGNLSNQYLTALGLLSYWMRPELGFILRLELYEIFRKRTKSEDLVFLYISREIALKYLLSSNRWNERSLGALLDEQFFHRVLNFVDIKFLCDSNSRVKRVQRHKGYRDKGTLPSFDSVARKQELQREVSLLQEQLKKEEYQENLEDYLSCNLNWLKSFGSWFLSEDYCFNSKKGVIYYEDDRITYTENFQKSGKTQGSRGKVTESRKRKETSSGKN